MDPLITSGLDLLIALGVLAIFALSLAYWAGRAHQGLIERRRDTQARQHFRALILIHQAKHLKEQQRRARLYTTSRN